MKPAMSLSYRRSPRPKTFVRWKGQRAPIRFAVLLSLAMLGSSGCAKPNKPLNELHFRYPLREEAIGSKSEVPEVIVQKTGRKIVDHYNGILDLYLSPTHLSLKPRDFGWFNLDSSIPLTSVAACAKTCFYSKNGVSAWNADVILGGDHIEISLPASAETLAWCWDHKIPVVRRFDRDDWMYDGQALLFREDQPNYLTSRETYFRELAVTCAGPPLG